MSTRPTRKDLDRSRIERCIAALEGLSVFRVGPSQRLDLSTYCKRAGLYPLAQIKLALLVVLGLSAPAVATSA